MIVVGSNLVWPHNGDVNTVIQSAVMLFPHPQENFSIVVILTLMISPYRVMIVLEQIGACFFLSSESDPNVDLRHLN